MNQNETVSANVSTTPGPTGDIPGVARVETLPPHNRDPHGSRFPGNTIMGDFVSGLLGVVARLLNPALVDRGLSFAKTAGHYAVLAGGALTLLYAIFGAIKYNSFAIFAI